MGCLFRGVCAHPRPLGVDSSESAPEEPGTDARLGGGGGGGATGITAGCPSQATEWYPRPQGTPTHSPHLTNDYAGGKRIAEAELAACAAGDTGCAEQAEAAHITDDSWQTHSGVPPLMADLVPDATKPGKAGEAKHAGAETPVRGRCDIIEVHGPVASKGAVATSNLQLDCTAGSLLCRCHFFAFVTCDGNSQK